MTNDTHLEPLVQSDLALADGEPDVRGNQVIDSAGSDLGRVDALYVDGEERRVRFLLVKGGGILGIGDTTRLVPVEAIDAYDVGSVRLREDGERVTGAPRYDPKLVEQQDYWEDVYGWYGYPPYWATGAAGFVGLYPYPGPGPVRKA